MAAKSWVQDLLDEISDSGQTPEEVCGDRPELLSEVRRRWRQMCAVRAELHALFPTTGHAPDADTSSYPSRHGGSELPRIPGYDVGALLGRGGMGVVYKARHLRLNRFVALKMLIAGAYAGPRERARFQLEAESVASLRHANIVQVYDVGEHEGWPYFTMELLEGGSLAQALAGTPQPARQAAALVATLAEAMEVAHRGGIVHRDLKPANILLTAEGTPKVADFGVARHSDGEPALTLSGGRLGTPSYMAPEQVIGKAGTIGPATDIYALGAVLYEMLTGRPPFRGETAAETEREVIRDEPVSPSRLNPKVPRDLETICLKCLSKEPGRRYASAAALAADLWRYVEGRPIQARRVSVPEQAWRWCRRNPAVAGLAAAAFLAMVLGTAVSAGQAIRAQRAVAAEKEANAAARARESEMRAVLEFVERRVLAAARPREDPGGLGREVTLRRAIDAALPAVAEGFAAQPLIEARLRRTLGQSYLDLGEPRTAAQQFGASRVLYTRQSGPDDPETLRSTHGLARSLHALGRVVEALKLLEETLKLQKARLGLDDSDTLKTMDDLAVTCQALGRWDEALAACARAVALGSDDHDTWNHAAILWARTGNRVRFRDHCHRMLDRFGPTTDPPTAERTAKACLLLPLGGAEQAAACDLADRIGAMARGHWVEPWAEATRGLAAYRREHFAEAVAWADHCLARGSGNWNCELPAHLVRSMALCQLGRRDEAGAALARASDLYRTKVASPGGRADGGDWHDQVICEVLRREAEADFLDRDFPPDPFARRTDPLTVAGPVDIEPRLIAP
jgi:tetratricopeptide (TPR) repeat protein